jgi:chromate transporter
MGALIDLFVSFFKIGAFSFGGGYAMLPLIQEEVIYVRKWISMAEYIDILAIAEMTPGPIAINSATFLGYKVAGIWGSALATFGVVLPSFIVMSLIFLFVFRFKHSPYVAWIFKGIRPIVLGLIAAAAVSVATSTFVDIKSVILAVVLFYLVAFRNINPIIAIIMAGIAGAVFF